MAENIHLYAMRSFYDHQAGGLVTLDNDVLSIVSQVKEMSDGRISVQLDPSNGWYHLVEHCEDTTDRLIFSVKPNELDGRVIERLQKADGTSRLHEDPYEAAEREQDALWAEQEYQGRQKILEAGEELAFTFRKVGATPRMPFPVAIPRDVNADR